jgi:hypothetical protein
MQIQQFLTLYFNFLCSGSVQILIYMRCNPYLIDGLFPSTKIIRKKIIVTLISDDNYPFSVSFQAYFLRGKT